MCVLDSIFYNICAIIFIFLYMNIEVLYAWWIHGSIPHALTPNVCYAYACDRNLLSLRLTIHVVVKKITSKGGCVQRRHENIVLLKTYLYGVKSLWTKAIVKVYLLDTVTMLVWWDSDPFLSISTTNLSVSWLGCVCCKWSVQGVFKKRKEMCYLELLMKLCCSEIVLEEFITCRNNIGLALSKTTVSG